VEFDTGTGKPLTVDPREQPTDPPPPDLGVDLEGAEPRVDGLAAPRAQAEADGRDHLVERLLAARADQHGGTLLD